MGFVYMKRWRGTTEARLFRKHIGWRSHVVKRSRNRKSEVVIGDHLFTQQVKGYCPSHWG